MAKSIPHVLRLKPVARRTVYHFKSAATRAKAAEIAGADIADIRDSHQLTALVQKKVIPRNLVKPVEIAVLTHVAVKRASIPARSAPPFLPIRPPSKHRGSKRPVERSARGMKKLEAAALMKANILRQREEGIDQKYLSAHARRRLRPNDWRQRLAWE